jgi:glutamine synthetase
VLNTIAAEAIDELADRLESKGGDDVAEAVTAIVAESYEANREIIFGGDNYADEWHQEAERRGLKNLRTTPEALPEVISEQTVATLGKYEVLSERELHSRFEVWLEQYTTRANIEAETTAMIAHTMLLPAALKYLAIAVQAGVAAVADDVRALVDELVDALGELESANEYPDGVEGLELAEYARDNQLAAMTRVREVADRLEKVVDDDLWPLPRYSEMLFIK